MTVPGQTPIPPVVPGVLREDDDERVGPVLGIGDADDQSEARDVEDNVPVGRADAEADARRTGADEDAV